MPLALKVQSLNYWITREVPLNGLFLTIYINKNMHLKKKEKRTQLIEKSKQRINGIFCLRRLEHMKNCSNLLIIKNLK